MYQIEQYDMVTSTNDIAREKALAGTPQGTVILARGQTAGRGRQGRCFASPLGTGLYMSIVLRPEAGMDALSITTRSAVAVAKVIERWTGCDAQIKWVNDIFQKGKKVCGILTEGRWDPVSGSLEYAILGIGINLLEPQDGFPESLRDIAGAIFADRGSMNLDTVRLAMAEDILQEYWEGTWNHYEEYCRRSMLIGKTVTVLQHGEPRYEALVQGVNKDFGLVVCGENGRERTLCSGEISVRSAE